MKVSELNELVQRVESGNATKADAEIVGKLARLAILQQQSASVTLRTMQSIDMVIENDDAANEGEAK